MNGLANIFGGLIGYGIGSIHAGIPAWKFPFIIFGSATIIWGFVFLLRTPSNPAKAKWLTEREKAIAVLRVAENETGIDNRKFKWYQAKEAFLDINLWLLNLLTIASCIPNVSEYPNRRFHSFTVANRSLGLHQCFWSSHSKWIWFYQVSVYVT